MLKNKSLGRITLAANSTRNNFMVVQEAASMTMDEEFDKNKKAALAYLNQKSEHNISIAEP